MSPLRSRQLIGFGATWVLLSLLAFFAYGSNEGMAAWALVSLTGGVIVLLIGSLPRSGGRTRRG